MNTLAQKPPIYFGQFGVFSDTFTEPVKGKISVFDLVTPTITRGLDFSAEESNDSVKKFLKNNPAVVLILADAKQAIPKYFGDVETYTEVFFDPEAEADEGTLFLIIRTKDDRMTAWKKLDRFETEWLIPARENPTLPFGVDIEPA